MKTLISIFIGVALTQSSLASSATDGLPLIIKNVHEKNSGCDPKAPGKAVEHRLGNQSLYIVPCLTAAYNTAAVAYIYDSAWGDEEYLVEKVHVLTYDGAIAATDYLMGAEFDPATQTISTFYKGRGIGDCGESTTIEFIVDPEYGDLRYYTSEIRNKLECDGKFTEWPVVFSQKMKR